ncbi:hypothetical protein BFP97_18695 [Roseivirga sp. 4D4]|uniref:DUF4199 domain-containing protein n=1 Tax=Roseivirga sp. 4D4 TaxID=1889784 RepID=UPI00085364D1|nr:DUF4199 domain-containing protein [Roseivirga sp. 4D4]OEK03421.1 hypothetical protein BFP97_18695 [Roseivirga sp. 4D4]
MKINPIIPRLSFRYGLAGGLMAIVAFLVFFYLDQEPWRNLISFMLDILIVGLFSFLSIKDFRSNYNNGELRFYHGMSLGFICYSTIAFVFAIFYLVFMQWIEPDFLNMFIETAKSDMELRKDMILQGVESDPEIYFAEQLASLDKITKSSLIFDSFLKKLIFGIFLTPIFSIVLRTRQA